MANEETQVDETAETQAETGEAPATGTADLGDAGKKALDDERKARRESDRQRRDLEKRLREFEDRDKTAQERAEARAAEAEARAASAVESIAAAKLEAALTGLVDDPAAEVADLNIRKFLGDDGQVDAGKVAALKARYAARAPQPGPRVPAPNPAQGSGQPQRSLAEIVADAEKSGVKDRAGARALIALKSQQMLQQRNQG